MSIVGQKFHGGTILLAENLLHHHRFTEVHSMF